MFRYRWPAGMWAFVLHRFTGVLFTAYLLTHIWVMHYLALGEQQFNQTMRFLSSPIFKFGEIGLLALVAYHGLNGIRIVLFDFADAFRIQRALFYGLFLLCIAIVVIGGYPLLPLRALGIAGGGAR